MSLFTIYYIKDVADINIKKYCNDIYCEAETSRFKLADNSYSLISSNDIFNTKTYFVEALENSCKSENKTPVDATIKTLNKEIKLKIF